MRGFCDLGECWFDEFSVKNTEVHPSDTVRPTVPSQAEAPNERRALFMALYAYNARQYHVQTSHVGHESRES